MTPSGTAIIVTSSDVTDSQETIFNDESVHICEVKFKMKFCVYVLSLWER